MASFSTWAFSGAIATIFRWFETGVVQVAQALGQGDQLGPGFGGSFGRFASNSAKLAAGPDVIFAAPKGFDQAERGDQRIISLTTKLAQSVGHSFEFADAERKIGERPRDGYLCRHLLGQLEESPLVLHRLIRLLILRQRHGQVASRVEVARIDANGPP